MVNIPIRVYPATRSMVIAFNMVCGDCHTPLKHKRWCSKCGREAEWKKIERGYGMTEDKIVALTEQEFERLQLKTVKSIEVQSFVDGTSIDSIYFDTHYYLAPAEGGEKAYSLLRDVLVLTNRVAIGIARIANALTKLGDFDKTKHSRIMGCAGSDPNSFARSSISG